MSVWFEGANRIDCSLERVSESLKDLGAHHVGVVSLMPGLSSVELLEQGDGFVTLQTNEGTMKRTGIAVRAEPDSVVVELHEEYGAKGIVTANSHFVHHFTRAGDAVDHRMVISEVGAPGVLGFVYRKFASSSIGNAFLAAYKTYLESPPESDAP